MLTTHFGETDIRKQEMHGIVEVGRSFVHIKYYNKHILIFLSSIYAIFGQPYLKDHNMSE